eukprot:c44023_g1_i1 orf=78-248(+)
MLPGQNYFSQLLQRFHKKYLAFSMHEQASSQNSIAISHQHTHNHTNLSYKSPQHAS